MRLPTPLVQHGLLHISDGAHEITIPLGSVAWYTWLETVMLFAFVSVDGTFTARKEQRQRGGLYWKAYRTQHGKLARVYLGKTNSLTQERLQDAARKLTERGTSLVGQSTQQLLLSSLLPQPIHRARALAERAGSKWQQHHEPLSRELFLSDKVLIPPLRSSLILRQRLIERLKASQDHQLILLTAPAGYGKTTLLCQWCMQSPWPVAWVSLEASENDPLRFWRYILTALVKIVPGMGQEALELLQIRPAPPVESIVNCLLNIMHLLSQDIFLILDDYHAITLPAIHAAMAIFVAHLPLKLHVVLASRTNPPLLLARLRVRHHLFELCADDLCFTPEEVATFFTTHTSLHLVAEDIATLMTATEGWIAALQLAALSLQNCSDIAGFLVTFTRGSHRSIADYLTEEVLQQQPASIHTFLLQTAILDRLSGPLCAAVVGEDGENGAASAQALLEHLEQANLFLIPLDDERRWYRYHHLFINFLRERLQRLFPQQIPLLQRRAAAWYESQGLLAEAIPYRLAAADFQQAAYLICQIGEHLVNQSEVILLRQWLNSLPDVLVHSSPQLCLLIAWTLVTTGEFEPAASWLQEAEEGLHQLMNESAITTTSQMMIPAPQSKAEKHLILQSMVGEIAAIQGYRASFWGELPAKRQLIKQALEQVARERLFVRGMSALNVGVAFWLSGDVLSASEALAQARDVGQATQNHYITLLATYCLAQVQMVQGQRHLAFATSQKALSLAADESGKALHPAAYAYIGMGQVYYEWNELDTATYYLEEGIALSERWGHGDMFVYGYTALAQVKQAQGDIQGAQAMIERAERYVHRLHHQPWVITIMVAQQVRLALLQGDLTASKRWTQQAAQGYVATFEEMTRARIYLAEGQPQQALALLEPYAEQAASSGRRGTLLEIRLLQALTYYQQHERVRCLHVLEEALFIAEPEGYIRLFLDEGDAMRSLLTTWLAARRHPAAPPRLRHYVQKLLNFFAPPLQAGAYVTHQHQQQALPPSLTSLSRREQEILSYLAAGQSNDAIAAALVLEVSTVKWHLTRMYRKLNVQSRTQAALQAKALRLLS